MPALLALGANIGDPLRQLRRAVDRLGEGLQIEAISDVFVTEPVGHRGQPDFYNLVIAGRTSMTVYDLHRRGQEIERELGRERVHPNGPRSIDVDLLAYGRLVLESENLTVPHPRMHMRSFVLVPLAEVAPAWRHPFSGMTAERSLAKLEEPSRVARWGPLPSYDE